MLPWNPPSSFSLGNEQRFGNDASTSQPQPPSAQQSPQQQATPLPPPPPQQQPYPPMTLAAALHFLQSEHRRYARDRNEWEIERAEMRARIALLEGEKRGNEGALKSLGRRCKMLEMALRGERSKFLSTTNALAGSSPSVSGTASPVPGAIPSLAKEATLGASAIPPSKLAALQKEGGASSAPTPGTPTSEAPKSAPMAASTSSPGQSSGDAARLRSDSASTGTGPTVNGFQTGTWSGAAAAATASTAGGLRDPRGKARSREYLKQCLQEITYLTSSATLNPLAAHSYAAPSVPRPRKVLPDHVPTSGPGVLNLAGGAPSSLPPATTGPTNLAPTELEPFANTAIPPSTAPAIPSTLPPPPPSLPPLAPDAPKQDLLTSFPSDPPSAFVPLRRQISQPGQPGRGRGAPVTTKDHDELDRAIAEMSKREESVKASDEAVEQPHDPVVAVEADEALKADGVKAEPLIDETAVVNAAPGAAAEKATPAAGQEAEAEPSAATSSAGKHDEMPVEQQATPEANEEKPDDADVKVVESAPHEEADDPFEPVGESSLQGAKDEDKSEEKKEGEVESAEEARSQDLVGRDKRFGTGTFSRGRGSRPGLFSSFGGRDGDGEGGRGSTEGGEGGGELSGSEGSAGGSGVREEEEEEVPTAYFRPDEGWKEKLAQAGRRAYVASAASLRDGGGGDAELDGLDWDLEDDDSGDSSAANGRSAKPRKAKQASEETVGLMGVDRYKARRVLKSHLDAVRAVAFVPSDDGETDLVTGGDDCVVKLWRGVLDRKSSRSDLEPVVTYRGHTAPVTALLVTRASEKSEAVVVSASLDSNVRLWRLPDHSRSTYDPVDSELLLAVFETHGDAVWGLADLSDSTTSRIACITASGAIQEWDLETGVMTASYTWGEPDAASQGSLKKRLQQRPTPTAITTAVVDGEQLLAVAFQNAVVKLFRPSSGEEVKRVDANESYNGTSDTQINAIAVCSDAGLIATAHEDNHLRVFDLASGDSLVATRAHLDGVTSVSFRPSSAGDSLLATSSHDGSVRLWSFNRGADGPATLTCVQEESTHRVKGAEGVLDVAFTSAGDALVSTGADGTVRVWQK
ncbi:1,2-dihydroxy-3-keto-5-methylthiopentene dioxygenase [Rhodotorula toruloides]|uniref:RHTO0S26e00430g2_1 n=2 Tax=Rhodotorula toruloides TaxID=5286 RepID=A0A061BJ08_RHOTO|nr:striatin-related protein [Rhodotorula toruloides NP11]EMS21343.1 striatin-related protein [Rhodotorula toruloides NP11]CDR49377.1 RHTO0S26e00430g2_1 [Rhodotorula toruloides]